MDWMQFGIFVLSTAGMFLWSRSESRSDIRHLENRIENKIDGLISELQTDRREFHASMRDFHGRLCSLEEKLRR